MARLVLLRHAQSGSDGIYYGRSDVTVTAQGRTQEEAILASAAGLRFSTVITSPLRRCRDLAARLAERTGAALEVEEELAEIDLGDWEGKSFDQAANIYREIARQLLDCDPALAFPGGESLKGFRERAGACFDRLALRFAAAGETVPVVCHGGVIRAVLARLRHSSPREFWAPDIRNATATVFHAGASGVRIAGVALPPAEAWAAPDA